MSILSAHGLEKSYFERIEELIHSDRTSASRCNQTRDQWLSWLTKGTLELHQDRRIYVPVLPHKMTRRVVMGFLKMPRSVFAAASSTLGRDLISR
jgi:hypothetical protein